MESHEPPQMSTQDSQLQMQKETLSSFPHEEEVNISSPMKEIVNRSMGGGEMLRVSPAALDRFKERIKPRIFSIAFPQDSEGDNKDSDGENKSPMITESSERFPTSVEPKERFPKGFKENLPKPKDSQPRVKKPRGIYRKGKSEEDDSSLPPLINSLEDLNSSSEESSSKRQKVVRLTPVVQVEYTTEDLPKLRIVPPYPPTSSVTDPPINRDTPNITEKTELYFKNNENKSKEVLEEVAVEEDTKKSARPKKMKEKVVVKIAMGGNSDFKGEHSLCCHLCLSSLVLRPRQFIKCKSCSTIVCRNCFGRHTKNSWEEAVAAPFYTCPICMGQCVCKRCVTRGPPKWFGKADPKWSHPTTTKEMQDDYTAKAQASQQRFKSPVLPYFYVF